MRVHQASMFESLLPVQTFEPSRLQWLPRGNNLLVMDRTTGRWVMLPKALEPVVRLLGTHFSSNDDVSTQLKDQAGKLRQALMERNIGSGERKSFDNFNTLIIKVTKSCNLACTYCYDIESGETPQAMDTELGLQAIRQAIDLCNGHLQIIFHGGEPMLVWDTIEQLVIAGEHYAREQDVDIEFTGQTNLTCLTDRKVKFSLDHQLNWGTSVDGPQAQNDIFRVNLRGDGSHRLFERALQRYPEFVRRCGVMTVITSATHDQLLNTARYFHDLGMAAWDWSLFQPIGRGRDSNVHDFDIEVLKSAWEALLVAVESGEFTGFPVHPVLKYLNNFYHTPGTNMCMRPQCGAARDLMSVSSDGRIEACDALDPVGPYANLGHLSNTSLQQARTSDTARTIRRRNVETGRCGSCIWYGVCGGTCLAHANGLHGIWDDACAMSLLAFEQISNSLANSDSLISYMESIE